MAFSNNILVVNIKNSLKMKNTGLFDREKGKGKRRGGRSVCDCLPSLEMVPVRAGQHLSPSSHLFSFNNK